MDPVFFGMEVQEQPKPLSFLEEMAEEETREVDRRPVKDKQYKDPTATIKNGVRFEKCGGGRRVVRKRIGD